MVKTEARKNWSDCVNFTLRNRFPWTFKVLKPMSFRGSGPWTPVRGRGVARLSASCWRKRNISSFSLILLSFSPTVFLSQSDPPSGRLAHLGRPWLRHWSGVLTLTPPGALRTSICLFINFIILLLGIVARYDDDSSICGIRMWGGHHFFVYPKGGGHHFFSFDKGVMYFCGVFCW